MVYHFCPIKSGLDNISGPKFTFLIAAAVELFSWSQWNMLFESSGFLGFIKTGEDPLELSDELFEIEGELFFGLE